MIHHRLINLLQLLQKIDFNVPQKTFILNIIIQTLINLVKNSHVGNNSQMDFFQASIIKRKWRIIYKLLFILLYFIKHIIE